MTISMSPRRRPSVPIKNDVEVLIAARALIEDPERWTRFTLARTRFGMPVPPNSVGAYAYCALGAIDRAATDMHRALKITATYFLNSRGKNLRVSATNDTGSHADVLYMFDIAIANARKEQEKVDAKSEAVND